MFLEEIRSIYSQYCEAVKKAKIAQWGVSSTLRVGILDGYVISGLFPKVINCLEREYSSMHIELFRGSFRQLTDSLYNESADMIITLEFSIRDKERLQFLPVSRTKDYMAMTRNNPLAAKEYISLKDMRNQVLIAISKEDSPFAYKCMSDMRSKIGVYLPQKDAPSLETCTLWTQAGLGITVLNSNNALALDPDVKFVPLENVEGFVPLNTDMVVAWHRDNSNHALEAFLNVFRRVQKKYPMSPPLPIY